MQANFPLSTSPHTFGRSHPILPQILAPPKTTNQKEKQLPSRLKVAVAAKSR